MCDNVCVYRSVLVCVGVYIGVCVLVTHMHPCFTGACMCMRARICTLYVCLCARVRVCTGMYLSICQYSDLYKVECLTQINIECN